MTLGKSGKPRAFMVRAQGSLIKVWAGKLKKKEKRPSRSSPCRLCVWDLTLSIGSTYKTKFLLSGIVQKAFKMTHAF